MDVGEGSAHMATACCRGSARACQSCLLCHHMCCLVPVLLLLVCWQVWSGGKRWLNTVTSLLRSATFCSLMSVLPSISGLNSLRETGTNDGSYQTSFQQITALRPVNGLFA